MEVKFNYIFLILSYCRKMAKYGVGFNGMIMPEYMKGFKDEFLGDMISFDNVDIPEMRISVPKTSQFKYNGKELSGNFLATEMKKDFNDIVQIYMQVKLGMDFDIVIPVKYIERDEYWDSEKSKICLEAFDNAAENGQII